MESLRFRSRIDAWVPLVLFGPTGLAIWLVVKKYGILPSTELIVAGVVCVAVFALMLWFFLDTSYAITDTELVVRSGPVRATIPISAIRTVRRSSTLLAGPALSLHRLEIEHGTYDSAIVSPARIEQFVAGLVARNPGIQVEGGTPS